MRREDFPPVLDVNDIMKILGIGRNNAYKLMGQKGFPVKQFGRLKRVPRDAFFNWLNDEAS